MMVFSLLIRSLLVSPSFSYAEEIPTINGPIPVVPFSKGMKQQPSDFVHPGIWHTHEQLDAIKTGVKLSIEPWASAYEKFSVDPLSQANYTIQGPYSVISRGDISNYSSFAYDARAAYQNALMWYITEDSAHLNASAAILDTWGSNLTNVIGIDRSLLVGLDGVIFVNAAEILRWEGGWTGQYSPSSEGASFSGQFYWLFSRQSIDIGQSNYGLVSIKALLDFAVYLDDVALYNYGLHAYQYDFCAGVLANYQNSTGQSSEMGRDQGHVQDSVGWNFLAARTAGNQGHDLYELHDNLIFRGAEYTAQYNLNQTVPFDPSYYRCEAVLVGGPWPNISSVSRGITPERPVWDIVYYTALERGIDVPWVDRAKQVVDLMGGEVTPNVSINDQPSWGDLLWGFNRTFNGTA